MVRWFIYIVIFGKKNTLLTGEIQNSIASDSLLSSSTPPVMGLFHQYPVKIWIYITAGAGLPRRPQHKYLEASMFYVQQLIFMSNA